MNDFTTKLKLYNDKIEELELEIIKKDFDLKYTKVLLKKLTDKKRELLTSYRT